MYLNKDLRTCENEKKEDKRTSIFTVIVLILCIMLFFTKFVWLKCVQVSGTSMNETLQDGDYLLMDRLRAVERGNIIVFTKNNMSYIKRVVAVGGDTVRIKDGNLYVKKQGEKDFEIQEYENTIQPTKPLYGAVFFKDQLIKDGYVFVLGDNRINSADSRDNRIGQVSLDEIDGVVTQFIIDKKDKFFGKFYRWL